jgi:hypothetical protein
VQPPSSSTAPPPHFVSTRPILVDAHPATLAALAIGAGVALDIGVRGGVHNLVVAAGAACVAAMLLTGRRVQQFTARAVVVVALPPIAFLALRKSPGLTAGNVATIAVSFGIAVAFARSGSIFDTGPGAVATRLRSALGRAALAPAALRDLAPRSDSPLARHGGRVGPPIAIALPILVVVVALLAASDPVFKRMLVPPLEPGPIVGHVVVAFAFVLIALGIGAAALGDSAPSRRAGRFGVLEVTLMLTLAAVVLGLFGVSQLVALSDAGDRFISEAGLTPAEYARSGFFQLCWATSLLVVFLGVVRALAAPHVYEGRAVRVLAVVVPVLSISLVVVSLRRMALYDDAFGLTMLRFWVVVAAVWMGIVLLLIAARNAGIGGSRDWLLGGAYVAAIAMVVGVNVANPEAFVVRHNVERAERGEPFDAAYLVQLSDDAVPALADALRSSRSASVREQLSSVFPCRRESTGVAELNVAARRAAAARGRVC